MTRWLCVLAALAGLSHASPAAAQDLARTDRSSRYGVVVLGASINTRERGGGAILLGARSHYRGTAAVGAELQYHELSPAGADYAPCPLDQPCPTGSYPGQKLIVALGVIEAFTEGGRAGLFLNLAAGVAAYTQLRRPASTDRWSVVVGAGAGLAVPVEQLRLRAEVRVLQLQQQRSAPTRLGFAGLGFHL